MEIYLIRHTTPLIDKGVCYGQTDLDITASFLAEATMIKNILPATIESVYSSPLQRCKKLALELFPSHNIQYHAHLQELNCGQWEMQKWDDIPKPELDIWMKDFVNVATPEGESYLDLYKRTTNFFNIVIQQNTPAAIVAHGGVLRSILSHISATPLKDSFDVFKLHYGCVAKIFMHGNDFKFEILHNIEPMQQEQHKPSSY